MALEADSWFCNFTLSKNIITRVFEKQAEKIKFLLPFTSSTKLLEKMPGLFLGYSLVIINSNYNETLIKV